MFGWKMYRQGIQDSIKKKRKTNRLLPFITHDSKKVNYRRRKARRERERAERERERDDEREKWERGGGAMHNHLEITYFYNWPTLLSP